MSVILAGTISAQRAGPGERWGTMSLYVFGDSFKDELAVRGGRQLESERHPLYQRQRNHAPLRVSNQQAFNRFMQQCYEEAERKARVEDAREREIAAREGRPYRSREERERIKKEREEQEKREREERKSRGESDGHAFRLKTFDASVSYYKTLGVDESASSKEIKRAYKKLALRYHPDKMAGKSAEEVAEAELVFKSAMEAYEILADEDTRERYDKARDKQMYGRNSPMNDPKFGEEVARRRERARREREVRMNIKEERIEVVLGVTLRELHDGCFREIQYSRRFFERNESGRFTKYEQVTKNLEIRKGWNPKIPLVLDSEGHQSIEYQTGNVYVVLQEHDHEAFERRGAKDLLLKDHVIPKREEGDILSFVSIDTLQGSTKNRVVSYLSLLLSGGGEMLERVDLCGMPDPKAPYFDPPGDLYFRLSLPKRDAYSFRLAEDLISPRKVYLLGNDKSQGQAAAAALKVCTDYLDVLSSSQRLGVCICLSTRLTSAAQAFVDLVQSLIAGFEWVTVHTPSGVGWEDGSLPLPALLDEEVTAVETADVVIMDPGTAPLDITNLIAPIDTEDLEFLGTSADKEAKHPVPANDTLSSSVAMSYGLGYYGQLALGERSTQSPSFREVVISASDDVGEDGCVVPMKISAGESHSAVLLSNGEVLTSGMGNFGQTGRPDCRNSFALEPVEWDYFTIKPKILSISCGGKHTLLLDDFGKVWSFGCGKYGQLGHGDSDDMNEPQVVWPAEDRGEGGEASAMAAVRISAGGSHSFVADSLGRAWSWGANDKGQLGLGDREARLIPTLVGLAGETPVSSVSAGKANTALLTTKGEVFTCGSCSSRLLGYAAGEDVKKPKKVDGLKSEIAKIKLQEHIAVACDNSGRIHAWGSLNPGRAEAPTSANRIFEVVHSKVVVRSGPSTSSKICGVRYRGDRVHAESDRGGWIKLAPQSHPSGRLAGAWPSFWMLKDGTHLKLGQLLREVSKGSNSNASGKAAPGVLPQCIRLEVPVQDVECFGKRLAARTESGRILVVDAGEAIRTERGGSVTAEDVVRADGGRLLATGVSASSSHIMAICDQARSSREDSDAGTGAPAAGPETEVPEREGERGEDPEEWVDRTAQVLAKQDIFRMVWRAHLRGAVIVGLGEACSLLGVNRGNCGLGEYLAVIPHAVRVCDGGGGGGGGLARLWSALESLTPIFPKGGAEPFNDVAGGALSSASAVAWAPPSGETMEVLLSCREAQSEIEEAAERYLSNQCLDGARIGGLDLPSQWAHRMSLRAVVAEVAGGRERRKLREERAGNLRMIAEEEASLAAKGGFVSQGGERSNFDVFGCERGRCPESGCERYAQPFHMGLASGSYAFLCANCGVGATAHEEVVH